MRLGDAVRRRRDDRGVTLIEVLVAISILTVIMVPLGNALISFFRNTDATSGRLSESHDAQIAAAYFAQDVQSLGRRDWGATGFALQQSIEVNVGSADGPYPCAPGTPNAAIRFLWDDTIAGVVRVSYVVQTVGTERQLRRITCIGSSAISSDLVLAHNLDPGAAVGPPVCSTSCDGGVGVPAVPQWVKLTLTLKSPATTGAGLTVTLVGQRRQS
jgi:prepilin-type N-terminal cleavage/methylation domain-containing protein